MKRIWVFAFCLCRSFRSPPVSAKVNHRFCGHSGSRIGISSLAVGHARSVKSAITYCKTIASGWWFKMPDFRAASSLWRRNHRRRLAPF